MKTLWGTMPSFWRDVVSTVVILCGVAGVESGGSIVYALPHGSFPARIIGVMRSQALLENPGVTGYYERLFAATPMAAAKTTAHRIIDRSFRIVRLKPNLKGWTNSFGFVGPEYSLRKPLKTRRVALLGDSLTQGLGATLNRSYPELLEQRLNATRAGGPDHRFEILNFAAAGYQLTQIFDIET